MREHAERAGDVDVDLGLDRLDARLDLGEQPLVRTADRGDDAELRRAGGRGLLGRLDELGDVQPDRADRRGELPGLRAEVAVLGAAARLQRDDALDLDLRAAPAHPDLVRQLQQGGQRLVGQPQDLDQLLLVEASTLLEHLGAGDGQDLRSDVGHAGNLSLP